MKPVVINFVSKENFLKKTIFPALFALFLIAVVFTGFNTYNYIINKNQIAFYEKRIKNTKLLAEKKINAQKKEKLTSQEIEKIQKDLAYLKAIKDKKSFPLISVLNIIERAKQEETDINEVKFSDNFSIVTIKGKSDSPEAVSTFLIALDRAERFMVEITREEINEKKEIFFDITARGRPDL